MALTSGIRGVDNLNPLNIKQGSSPWAGSTGADARGHAVFIDPAYSVRALLRLAWVYSRRYKLTTLRQMLDRWAPADDTQGSIPGAPHNQPNAQAAFVARAVGKGVDDQIDLFDADGRVQPRLLYGALIDGIGAMIEFECGVGIVYETATIRRGIAIYHKLL